MIRFEATDVGLELVVGTFNDSFEVGFDPEQRGEESHEGDYKSDDGADYSYDVAIAVDEASKARKEVLLIAVVAEQSRRQRRLRFGSMESPFIGRNPLPPAPPPPPPPPPMSPPPLPRRSRRSRPTFVTGAENASAAARTRQTMDTGPMLLPRDSA